MTFLEFTLPGGRKISLLPECIESVEVSLNASESTDIGMKSGCLHTVPLPYEQVKEQVEAARLNLEIEQLIGETIPERVRELMGASSTATTLDFPLIDSIRPVTDPNPKPHSPCTCNSPKPGLHKPWCAFIAG